MTSATGVRIRWDDLPERVHAGVADILGSPVAEAVSQPGGFSPGTADRVRTADGRRAFVKAVSPAQNPHSPGMHRSEAAVAAALPPNAPAPALLGVYDDGDWIALVLTDVAGRHPRTPWVRAELVAVLDTLAGLSRAPVRGGLRELPAAVDALADDFTGWRRIAADPPPDLDPWYAARLPELRRLAERGLAALAGDRLVHLDVRADNLLIGPDGRVTVVDWPWACRGPSWLDSLMVLVNVRLYGGATRPYEARLAADPAEVTAVLAGLAGFFTDYARRPPPPGLPTVRAFQRRQADALRTWLGERLGG